MKMPAFQFYPADWRKDPGVQALEFHDRGVWFEILCIMHESSERGVLLLNGAPMPETALARLLGLDNQILNQTLTNLITYGVASRREADGALYSRRMVKDENLCQVRRQAGKKGGNPNLVNQKTNQKPTTGDNQKPTPSSSTSSTTTADAVAATAADLAAPAEKPASQPAEVPADEAPVFLAAGFRDFLAKLDYGPLDSARYLLDIQRKANDEPPRTNKGWENYIAAWLKRDYAAGLLLAAPGSVPAPAAQQRFGPPPTAAVATGSYDRAAIVAKQAQIVT